MTLTKTQIFHRTESLSGEIKAAREAQSECRKALADQERLTHIAAQAVERADARVAELEAERAELAERAHAAILQVGDPPPLADEDGPKPEMHVITQAEMDANCLHHGRVISLGPNGGHICDECGGEYVLQYNSIFTEPADFQAQAMQNGLDRIGEIVDEARR